MQFAINVDLAIQSDPDRNRNEKAIGTSMLLAALMGILLIVAALAIIIFDLPVLIKYSFPSYVLAVAGVVGLASILQVLTNVYRVYGIYLPITATELFRGLLLLIIALVFRGRALIVALLVGMVCAAGVGVVVLVRLAPFRIPVVVDLRCARRLLSVGIPLLVYNLSFHMIAYSAHTIVSVFYSVQIMGYYSLANSLVAASLLGLNTITWVVFPSVLSRTRQDVDDELVARTVKKVNVLYGTAVFLFVFLTILLLPALFLIIPQFRPVRDTLTMLLLSQAILSLCFGYNCVAIARKRQMAVARISVLSVIVVVGFGMFVGFVGLDYQWIAVAVLLGSSVFTLLQTKLGARLIRGKGGTARHIKEIVPIRRLVPLLFFVLATVLPFYYAFVLIGTGIFVLLNFENLMSLWDFSRSRIAQSSWMNPSLPI